MGEFMAVLCGSTGDLTVEMGDLSPSHGPSAVYFRAYSWAKAYVLETTHEINGLRSSHAMGIQA